MRVDPNKGIEMIVEHVMVHPDRLELYDGSDVTADEIAAPGNAFRTFCEALDPNRCYIAALVPDEAGRPLFYQARDIASQASVHIQATMDTPDRHFRTWEAYKIRKAIPSVADDDSEAP